MAAAAAHYRRWWDAHFGQVTELAGLSGEANELRYRPVAGGVILRVGEDAPDEEVAKALHAAALCGTPVHVSSSRPRRHGAAPSPASVTVESAASLAASLSGVDGARLRLVGKPESEVVAAAAEQALTVMDEPICSHGRIELVRWLREQVVTRSLHRYGTVVYGGDRRGNVRPPSSVLSSTAT